MIEKYCEVLDEKLINDIFNYLKFTIDKHVWSSSNSWKDYLVNSSSIVSTSVIFDKNLVIRIKNSIEKKINVNFNDLDMDFYCSIYLWSRMSYITWHDDDNYPYSGTVYLTKKWKPDDGGIFLWRDNLTNEIKGIEPIYNTMVVNSHHEMDTWNQHCVTCIVPDVPMSRVTLQWRTMYKKNLKKIKYSNLFEYN